MTYLLPELTQDRAAPIPDPTGLSPIAAIFAARQVDHLMLAIVELRDGACRWPVAEFDRNEYLYCGDATRDKACPYCREHAALAYHQAGRRRTTATQADRQKLIELYALEQ
jgi:GcrA cell cycle regulator